MGAILLKDIGLLDGRTADMLISGGVISKIAPAGESRGWELAGDLEIMDCATERWRCPGSSTCTPTLRCP